MVGHVAYCQAYTSSHGDTELSAAISDLFTNIPKEAWPYIYYYREGMETEKRYTVRCVADQFTSKVTIMNKNMFNRNLGTAYHRADVTMFVYTDILTTGDEYSWEPLKEAIKTAIFENKPLLVFCPDNMDGFTRRTITEMLVDDVNHNVAVFTHHMEHPQLNDFRILALLTKQLDLSTKFFIVKNVEASCKGHELVLNNLFKAPMDASINPLLNDPDYPLFRQQVEEIKSVIDQAKEEATYRDTVNEITHYVSIYNRLYFVVKWMIVVGGRAYDNSAAMDVLMDTIHAVNRSLTEGYTGGANIALCEALLGMKKQILESINSGVAFSFESSRKKFHLKYYIVCSCIDALEDVYKGISFYSSVKYISPLKMIKNHPQDVTHKCLFFLSNHGWSIDNLVRAVSVTNCAGGSAPCIQPADLVAEVLSRIEEVCLKFLKADHILTINGVYTPPKKKNWFQKLFNR